MKRVVSTGRRWAEALRAEQRAFDAWVATEVGADEEALCALYAARERRLGIESTRHWRSAKVGR